MLEQVFDLTPFGVEGDLRYNEKGYIRAVCKYHPHDACRRQRQVIAGRSEGSGRPIGALVHWLRRGCDCRSQVVHVGIGPGTYNERTTAREWFQTLAGSEEFLKFEREQRPGEGKEPKVFR